MSVNVMLLPFRPMSNNERQRHFRERNPGYYGRLHARGRAGAKAGAAQLLAAAKAMAEKHEPLALPAPAVTIEIPGMTMIPAIPAPLPLPVPEQTTSAAGFESSALAHPVSNHPIHPRRDIAAE
jgi:hypothetical protein